LFFKNKLSLSFQFLHIYPYYRLIDIEDKFI
jgi:hypothetical protein